MRYFLDNGQIYRNIHDKHKAYLNTHCLDYRNTHGKAIEILMDHKKVKLYVNNIVFSKELNVRKGEYLEVLNNDKKWWRCRDSSNKVNFFQI